MGKKRKKVTIGYRYCMGIHMGLCRGPVDEIVAIRVGDRPLWSGSMGQSGDTSLHAPDLFGGEEREGGISGTLTVLMGQATQPRHARLAAMLGGAVPAFRGVCSVFFDGLVCAMSPYPKPWAFRVRRVLKGWSGDKTWQPQLARIVLGEGEQSVHAMNPAHILWQLYTDPRLGRGLPEQFLDEESFKAAAELFAREKFGLCLAIKRSDEVEKIAQAVLDHVGAVAFTSRQSGRIVLRPIRDDYRVEDLPVFTWGTGLLSIEDDETASVAAATNEVIVQWRDPVRRENRATRAKNLGAISAGGGITRTTTLDYPGICTAELAARVAARELRSASSGARRMTLKMNRRASQLNPADVFVLSAPERGIERIVLRAVRCEWGTPSDATITIQAVQDVFGLPAAVLVPVEAAQMPAVDSPRNVQRCAIIEAPWFFVAQILSSAEQKALPEAVGFVLVAAQQPTSGHGAWDLQTMDERGRWRTSDRGRAWCATAELEADLSPQASANIALVAPTGAMSADLVGTAALIASDQGEEFVRIDALWQRSSDGAWLAHLARGCADTTARAWPAGSLVWFLGHEGAATWDDEERLSGTTARLRLITHTASGSLADSQAIQHNLPMVARAHRPYPPGCIRINGQTTPATIEGDLHLSWCVRDRLSLGDRLIGQDEASAAPAQTSIRTRVRIYTGERLIKEWPSLSQTTLTFTQHEQRQLNGGQLPPSLRIVIDAVDGPHVSWTAHTATVERKQ